MYPWTTDDDELDQGDPVDALVKTRAAPAPFADTMAFDPSLQAVGQDDPPLDLGTPASAPETALSNAAAAQAQPDDDAVSSLATPQADASLPEQYDAPPANWQNPGPSPMFEAYRNQQMHMLPNSGPHDDAVSQMASSGGGSSDDGGDGRTWGLLGAGLLDVLLNRGRHAGALLGTAIQGSDPYEQQKRALDLEHTRAEIDHLRKGGDPSLMAWHMAQLDARNRALDMQAQGVSLRTRAQDTREKTEARNDRQWRELNDPNSQTSLALQRMATQNGIPESSVKDQSAASIAKILPAANEYLKSTGLVGEARTEQSARTAGAEAAATEDSKIRIAKAGAQGQQDIKEQPIDAFIDSIKNNPDIRAHFTDNGAAMRARLQINPRGAQSAVDDIKANNRALDALDRLSAIEAEWKKLGALKYVPKSGIWSMVALAPGTDEYNKAAGLEQEYHDLMTEVQGVKARIAQSAGSAGEREEANSAMPGLGNFTASPRLSGTRSMLQTNTAANLSVLGMAPDGSGDGEKRRRPAGAPSAQRRPRPLATRADSASDDDDETGDGSYLDL